ncbi:Glycosyl transferase group 1 [Gammaproteobacteria bacterium]
MAHVVLIGALPESLTNFRGDLIRVMVSLGHQVTTMAGAATTDQVQAIESLGVNFRSFPVRRNGLNPWQDMRTLLALRKTFHEIKPDVVLSYTIKPVIWGGLALIGMKSVSYYALITGLGFAFQGEGLLRKILAGIISGLYRAGLTRATRVIFQNVDNRNMFVSRHLVPASKCVVIAGSGVDLSRFGVAGLPESNPAFLLIARLLGEKGLREYAHAARLVKQYYPGAVFRLLGPVDPSPDRIPLQEVRRWHAQEVVEYLGSTSDVRPFIADCHVYVLPSYHEGMPRTVLEAMSMGRPILTTDVSGCRETVVPGENGYLVPKADAEALAERLIWFIEHRDQWQRMGQASRRMAEERFDVHKINAKMLCVMGLDVKSA